MNILLAADVSIKDVIGGAERVLHEQSVRLAQKGHTVRILTRKLPDHTCSDEIIDGVHEYRYAVDTRNPVVFLLSTIINGQKIFKQMSRQIKFDVINVHQPFTALAINLLPAARHIPKIYTCHSLAFEEYISRNVAKKSFGFMLHVFLRRAIEKFSLTRCRAVIALSQFTKNKLLHAHNINNSMIHVIPGGVDIDHFRPAPDKAALRKELEIPSGNLILFSARNLIPRMGLENFIRAIPLLNKKGVPVHLFIGGQGELKAKLQHAINSLGLQNSITLCGFLSNADLLKFYQMADFFILPTVELEGFGLVTVEAMACGTPVLATPVGGSLEILGKFENSFIFKDTSPQAIAELIFAKYEYYKNNPSLYQDLRADVRAFTEKYYSWEKNVQELEKILAQH